MKEKAYKVLAHQIGISNKKAKELIDRGVVYIGNRKVEIARGLVDRGTTFSIKEVAEPQIIYEDENLIALNKPPHLTSEEIAQKMGYPLLHRLDRETSGLLILAKDRDFRRRAIEEFKKGRVYKEYRAWVEGIVAEPFEIDYPILTIKKGGRAKSHLSRSKGKPAKTYVEPLELHGKKMKVKAVIETGRTHQIRLHLARSGHPILGDTLYGGRPWRRIMLHGKRMRLFHYDLDAPEPEDFTIR
ncbi:MAG: RluA family pseudouridine synthase [Epsilonproteobacteria bacterium]|nr:RNA pseudouridine synthase [Campylobacterota bacterium]NPA56460.1 RluA family pseudouridine synthase [Campylobacterota bacterium]